ncbi:MAG TPA: hypothetical protein VF815_17180 [Myxococcaceae bacterium]|jgi:hypothetical protein
MRRSVTVGFAGLTCALGVMWLTSYSHYTSLGLDMDRVEGAQVRFTYWRVRWPGDGSFRLGGGAHYRPLESGPAEAFDLGGTFFQPPQRAVPGSWWNRLGFWWVDEEGGQEGAKFIWRRWVGVPSWLPLLLSVAILLRARRAGSGS